MNDGPVVDHLAPTVDAASEAIDPRHGAVVVCMRLALGHGHSFRCFMHNHNPRDLRVYRASMVRKYLAFPATWPDGIDTKYDRWYTDHQAYWDALSKKVDGPLNSPHWIDPLDDPIQHPQLHSDGYPEDDVPRRVDATKKPATKIRAVNNATEISEALAQRQRGRPSTGNAMSSTERSRLRRDKLKDK
jgi:hypothetical protein